MSSIEDRLREDLKDAMRQRDDRRRTTIRSILSAIQYEQIARQKPLNDTDVLDVLSHMVRQHQESIVEFKKGNRSDLVEKEESELAIVRQYMPQQLGRDEITELARQVIAKTGAKGPSEMGKVMGQLMPQVRGKADGTQVSQIVTELLSGSGG